MDFCYVQLCIYRDGYVFGLEFVNDFVEGEYRKEEFKVDKKDEYKDGDYWKVEVYGVLGSYGRFIFLIYKV